MSAHGVSTLGCARASAPARRPGPSWRDGGTSQLVGVSRGVVRNRGLVGRLREVLDDDACIEVDDASSRAIARDLEP